MTHVEDPQRGPIINQAPNASMQDNKANLHKAGHWFPPRKITQGYFLPKGTVILWMRMYKHGMIADPMDHCESSVG